jgi:hypothetical protein
MSLLWESKEERIKKIEKLKTLATTVDGLPRLLRGVGEEIGKQFHVSLNALQGYHEEQYKEIMLTQSTSEKNIMAALVAVTEGQKAEFAEQLKTAQLQTLKSVGEMIQKLNEKLDEKLENLVETGEESRAVAFGIAEVIQRTIDAVSEGVASIGNVVPIASVLKQKEASNSLPDAHYFSRSDRM